MDAINVIYESFGGEKIARIFRTYWLLLLIIKQVMFSLFAIDHVEQPVPLNTNEHTDQEITATKTKEETSGSLVYVRIFLALTQPGHHKSMEEINPVFNPNPPIQEDETL